MLLAMPGLRALCADSCPPEARTEEPPCHEDHGADQPPADPAGSCTHGDALSATAARVTLDGPADGGPKTGSDGSLRGRFAEGHPAPTRRLIAPPFAAAHSRPPLRC